MITLVANLLKRKPSMSNKVYISCPLNVDMKHVKGVENALKGMGFCVNYWDRSWPSSRYTDDPVRYCDIFVIILPDGKWSISRAQLPAGTYKELKLAITLGKPIYMGYLGVISSMYAVYQTEYDNERISGVRGSADHIKAFAPKIDPWTFKATPDQATAMATILDDEADYASYDMHKKSKRPISPDWPGIGPPPEFDNSGYPIFPKQKLQARIDELDYDERLLLFYKPSK